MKQPRNIFGQPLTLSGEVDRRNSRDRHVEHGGMPYHSFRVQHMPGDARPWHVMKRNLATDVEFRYSRHRTEDTAERRAERERRKEPGRRPKVRPDKWERR